MDVRRAEPILQVPDESGFVRFWGSLGAGLILLGGLIPVEGRWGWEGFWVWTLQAWGRFQFALVHGAPLLIGTLVLINLKLLRGRARGVANVAVPALLAVAFPLATCAFLSATDRFAGVLVSVQLPVAGVAVAAAHRVRRRAYDQPLPRMIAAAAGTALLLSLLLPTHRELSYRPLVVFMFQSIYFWRLEMLGFAGLATVALAYGTLALLSLVRWADPSRIGLALRACAYLFLGSGVVLLLVTLAAGFLVAAKELALTLGCTLVLGVGLYEWLAAHLDRRASAPV